MRETMGIWVWIVTGVWIPSSAALTITGEVVDSKARPVPGAEVVMCEHEPVAFWGEVGARMVGPVVRTDAEGRFAFEVQVARQRAFIVARKPGLAYGWEWLSGSLDSTPDRKHFPLVLEPAGVLAGRVVDPEGKPVAGAEVQATPVNTWGFSPYIYTWSVPGPPSWFAVTTDAQGRFRFEQFAADVSAALRVQVPGGASRYVFHPYGSVFARFDMGQTDLHLVLPREGTVRGRALDGQSRPVGGLELMIRSARERVDTTNLYVTRKTKSDRAGTFAFAGVPEGPQEIELLPSERKFALWTGRSAKVSVRAGAVAETIFRVSQGGVLAVTALDARTRQPVPGARLEATGKQWFRNHVAIADAQGVARLRVPADFYVVCVSAAQFSHCQSSLTVTEGQTIRREALLPPSPRASGRVLDPQGRPAVDAIMSVYPGGLAYTDAQGRFTTVCRAQTSTQDGFVMGRDMKRNLAAAVAVSDLSQPIELRLEPAWTLTGRVTEPNGTPIPAARVCLGMKLPGALWNIGVGALSDPAGRFEMKVIPLVHESFTYYLSASAAGYGQVCRVRIFPQGPAGTAVDLGTIRLPPANVTVSGVVVDAKGQPAARVPVRSNSWPEQQPHKSTATNEKGEFAFTRLCQGQITFQANTPNSPGGAGFLRTRLPAQNVRIVLGKDLTDLPKLPGANTAPAPLTDLCPYLSFLHTDGRPLLLCLTDAQASSQQCLIDLARKADDLETKGVIAVVLTHKVDFEQREAFRKANRIPFPHGPVGDDFEALKAAWGIEFLPWLILTDTRHNVVAVGFSLDELDKKMQEAAGR